MTNIITDLYSKNCMHAASLILFFIYDFPEPA